ncbi:MAG: riboflavin synthase [Halobacteriales archaeon]
MFTGIVEGTAEVVDLTDEGAGIRLHLESALAADLEPGDSVAVSGACLTAEAVDPPCFQVFLAEETRERTYLGRLDAGDAVNVERPLPVDGRLDGHLVQGHVDATTRVRDRWPVGEDWRYAFDLPTSLAPYVVERGSVAVDGISLTVAERSSEHFEAAIIPETLSRTTLDDKAPGDPVHLEVDVVARYVEQLLPERVAPR